MKGLLFFLGILSMICGSAQTSAERELVQLRLLADGMINMSQVEHRRSMADQFYDRFIAHFSSSDFDHTYEQFPWLTSLYSQDSMIQMVSTGYELEHGRYDYMLFMKQRDDDEIMTWRKQSDQFDNSRKEYLDKEGWIPAWYSSVIDIEVDSARAYLLFGLNKYNKSTDVKVCEVLSFDDEGQPVFGKPIFVTKKSGTRDAVDKRLLLSYSDPAQILLRYDSDVDAIVHNHILAIPSETYEGEMLRVQDGSYEVYRREGESWVYDPFLFEQTNQQATPTKKDKPKRDLFGNPIDNQ